MFHLAGLPFRLLVLSLAVQVCVDAQLYTVVDDDGETIVENVTWDTLGRPYTTTLQTIAATSSSATLNPAVPALTTSSSRSTTPNGNTIANGLASASASASTTGLVATRPIVNAASSSTTAPYQVQYDPDGDAIASTTSTYVFSSQKPLTTPRVTVPAGTIANYSVYQSSVSSAVSSIIDAQWANYTKTATALGLKSGAGRSRVAGGFVMGCEGVLAVSLLSLGAFGVFGFV